MLRKILISIIVILILGIIGAIMYWFIYLKNPTDINDNISLDNTSNSGFSPFDRSKPPVKKSDTASTTDTVESDEMIVENKIPEIPKLRQLSITPISGISASSTKNSSIARFIDRGTGHIYESDSETMEIKKISNTTLPKTYESFWNKNLNAFITRYLKNETDDIVNFYAELKSTGTTTTVTPYEIKGRYLSSNINQIAVSPNRDRVFTWNIENGNGIGYISLFDDKNKIEIVNTPMRQVVLDWPETNTVSITSKASGLSLGYMYFIDIKTNIMKKVISGVKGLTAKANRDLSKIIYTTTKQDKFLTLIYDTKDNTSQEIVFKTISDKCVWSTLRKNELYCAVPIEIATGIYPDDWYRGNSSFIDQIWHLDAITGEVHLLANLMGLSGKLIDATELTLDQKENFLYFINKRDLTAWSLDLNK